MEEVPDSEPPRFSLIVTTLGDAVDIKRLLDSLARQSERRFEVIVVDQNADPIPVAEAVSGDWAFPVDVVRAADVRGASRGRNLGLPRARGGLVVFPDDDCWYPPDFLSRAAGILRDPDLGFACGRAVDEAGRTINGRFEATAQPVTRGNVWTTSIEWLQVLRRDALIAVGGYDETIGVGASTPWQSAEAQDLLLRVLANGIRGTYDPDLVGHHDELPVRRPDRALRLKLRRYARGMGYVLRKHGFRPSEAAEWFVRPIGGGVLALLRFNPRRAILFGHVAIGRIEGYSGRLLNQGRS